MRRRSLGVWIITITTATLALTTIHERSLAQGGARDADRDALLKAARDYTDAFEKADAKRLASYWTDEGEYHSAAGVSLRGRAEIEKAFDSYFKSKPKSKVDVLIESIRFPAKDLAIEEGVLRQSSSGAELPTSSLYSVIHVREGGQWKIAQSREWGAGKDRLEDLEWLVGDWNAKIKDKDVTLSFAWDKTKPFVSGSFVTKIANKPATAGHMKIGFDSQRGRIRSWHFDDDGGHGQSLWIRDGASRWVMDSIGTTGDGVDTASLNILTRLGDNEILWRSIDRVIGGRAVPSTVPIKLTRVLVK